MKTDSGKAPSVGQTYNVYGQTCRIVKVYDFGTMDVETLDGSRAYRVTGLPFIKQPIDSFGQTADINYKA